MNHFDSILRLTLLIVNNRLFQCILHKTTFIVLNGAFRLNIAENIIDRELKTISVHIAFNDTNSGNEPFQINMAENITRTAFKTISM